MIRDKAEKDGEKVKLGKAKGIRLEKNGLVTELYSSDEALVKEWRWALGGMIN